MFFSELTRWCDIELFFDFSHGHTAHFFLRAACPAFLGDDQPAVAETNHRVCAPTHHPTVVVWFSTLSLSLCARVGLSQKGAQGPDRGAGSGSKRQRRGAKKETRSPLIPIARLPSTLEHLVAGTVGGISGALVSYPLDTVRVR